MRQSLLLLQGETIMLHLMAILLTLLAALPMAAAIASEPTTSTGSNSIGADSIGADSTAELKRTYGPRAGELAALHAGVGQIAFPGMPGRLSVFGPNAFVVVAADTSDRTTQRVPIIAAARYGQGRIVALAHNGYFAGDLEQADTGQLVANLICWAASEKKGSKREPVVGIVGYPKLLAHFKQENIHKKLQSAAISKKNWLEGIGQFDAIVCPTDRLKPAEIARLTRYVKGGGGLLTAFPGWAWVGHFAGPGETLSEDFPPNQLYAPAGIVWGDGGTKNPPQKLLPITPPSPAMHALNAFQLIEGALKADAPADLARASFILSETVRSLPSTDRLLRPQVDKLIKRYQNKIPIPSAKKPIRTQDAAARALIAIQSQQWKDRPPRKIGVHPAAAIFPGTVPDRAKRIARKLSIDTSVPDWHGTGLYAAPGELVTLRAARAVVDGKLKLRIGCHRDRLWKKEEWKRFPEITLERPIEPPKTEAASPFGGLVYVVVPRDCKLGRIEVEISGCVPAPRFVLGETKVGEWCNTIRQFPAPWAELETDKIILTVPSADIRELAFPDKLMTWWDRVLDAQADLRTIPRERVRPERIVVDQQISAGYLHAGYPIMGHLIHGREAVDLKTLKARGNWGFYHELGHNHQRGEWTYRGMTEVTVNLFSLYCLHTINPGAPIHPAITDEKIVQKIASFRDNGKKGNPFLELLPYMQLQRRFGWDTFKRVFAEYEALPKEQRPQQDQEKRDQWLVRFSRAAGHNLGPFFEWWKIETTPAARESISDLPVWMPEELRTPKAASAQ